MEIQAALEKINAMDSTARNRPVEHVQIGYTAVQNVRTLTSRRGRDRK